MWRIPVDHMRSSSFPDVNPEMVRALQRDLQSRLQRELEQRIIEEGRDPAVVETRHGGGLPDRP
jgi:hypothetical protein